jgi:hypothetical protein
VIILGILLTLRCKGYQGRSPWLVSKTILGLVLSHQGFLRRCDRNNAC